MEYKLLKGYPNYKFYENGDVYNHKLRKLSTSGNYRINLYANGKGKMFRLLVVLYELFNNKKLSSTDDIKFKNKNSKNLLHYTNLIKTKRVASHKNLNITVLDKNKKWKIIKHHPNYKISNYGDVYSIRLNRLLITYKDPEGYINCGLMVNRKQTRFRVHRLVYDTFKGLSNNKDLVIDHKNGKKHDNYIGNLRETTKSINSINVKTKIYKQNNINQYTKNGIFIKTWESAKQIEIELKYSAISVRRCCRGEAHTYMGFIWKNPNFLTDITGYVTVLTDDGHKFSNFKIDKDGNIINNKNKLFKSVLSQGYPNISITSDAGKKIKYYVHRLVAMTFIENPNNYPIVNHIDKNKLNHNVSNLEWCTFKHNGQHGLGKKVNKIDAKTNNIITTYNSMSNAYEDMNKNYSSSICRACQGKQKTSYGFKWAFVD